MKLLRTMIAIACAACMSGCAGTSSAGAQDVGQIFSDVLHQRLPGDSSDLSKGEVVSGLKEALTFAAQNAGERLGAKDGFFRDPSVKIPLPGVLNDAQTRLEAFGMAGPLDDLQLKLNRGAEAAMPAARTLVVDAVRSLTIDDALGILRGGDTAATELLRSRTEVGLEQALTPYIEDTLEDVGALSALDQAVARYGAGMVKADARSTLTEHAVDYAMNGLFQYVAAEEQAIRRDPVKRTTELLRRVFGG